MPDKKIMKDILMSLEDFSTYFSICGDDLHELVRLQTGFMERFNSRHVKLGEKFIDPNGSARHGAVVKFIHENLAAITNEAEEIRDWTPWKHWKKYNVEEQRLDLDEIRFEYIDMLHFVIEALIYLGMDGEDVFRYYLSKHMENLRRQKEEYNNEY